MPPKLKHYDPKNYDISFAGIPLNEGLADGTFITVAPAVPRFTKKVGVDGEVTRSKSHDYSATVTLTLMQTSSVNAQLSAIARADAQGVNGAGVGAFRIQDRFGTTVLRASKAYISDPPDFELGAEASTREWTFELADLDATHGGNPAL